MPAPSRLEKGVFFAVNWIAFLILMAESGLLAASIQHATTPVTYGAPMEDPDSMAALL